MQNDHGRKKHTILVRHNGQQRSFEVGEDDFVIGRGDDADVSVDTPEISRHHAKVSVRGGNVTVRDLGSSNGTFVGGRRIRKHEDSRLPADDLEFTLGRSVRVTLTLAVKTEQKTLLVTSAVEKEPSRVTHSINNILDMERKRLYEGVDSLKGELSDLLAQKREIEKGLAKSREEVEEKVLALRVEKLDLENALKDARDRIELEMEAMEAHRERIAREHESELNRIRDEHKQKMEAFDADAKARMAKNYQLEIELNRISSGLEENLASLRRQTEQAEEAHRARVGELETEARRLDGEITAAREALETAKRESEAATQEIMEARLSLDRDKDLAGEELSRLREEADLVRKEIDARRDEADRVRSEIADVDASLDELREIYEKQKERFDAAEADHRKALEETKALRDAVERDREMHELEKRRHHAQLETTALELQSRKTAFESDIESCKLEQMKAKRDLQEILDQRAAEQKACQTAETRVAELKGEITSLEQQLQKGQTDVTSAKSLETEAAAAVAKLKGEEAAVQESIAKVRRELMTVRRELESERSGGRENIDAEIRSLRETAQAEIERAKESERQKFEAEKAKRIEELEKEFARKGTAMELDLAQAKLNKLGELEKMGEEKAALDRYRRDFMVNEIVRGAQELARGTLTSRGDDLRAFVRDVLEGKTASATSAQTASRTNQFWLRVGASLAAPVAMVALLVFFPEIPAWFRNNVSRKIASEKKENGIFYEQIRQKGMKYQPEQTREYRATYAENLLYAEGYADMKLSDDEKKKWILVLNDFIVGRLGLGDRLIPNFISAESIMVGDLMKVRESMLPQFKDQSLARMAEIEKAGADKLTALLDGPANYQKFRALEKSYYEDYLGRRPARPAAEPAPEPVGT